MPSSKRKWDGCRASQAPPLLTKHAITTTAALHLLAPSSSTSSAWRSRKRPANYRRRGCLSRAPLRSVLRGADYGTTRGRDRWGGETPGKWSGSPRPCLSGEPVSEVHRAPFLKAQSGVLDRKVRSHGGTTKCLEGPSKSRLRPRRMLGQSCVGEWCPSAGGLATLESSRNKRRQRRVSEGMQNEQTGTSGLPFLNSRRRQSWLSR